VRRSCLLTGPGADVIFVGMVIATGRVVDGRVELDSALPEGASVTVLVLDDEGDDLSELDREALHAALTRSSESLDAGRVRPASAIVDELRSKR
jgi:hypothetical protein